MSHFAKRHYEAIALALQEAQLSDPSMYAPNNDEIDANRRDVFENVIGALAAMFARDNSEFKRARFMAACIPGNNVRART